MGRFSRFFSYFFVQEGGQDKPMRRPEGKAKDACRWNIFAYAVHERSLQKTL